MKKNIILILLILVGLLVAIFLQKYFSLNLNLDKEDSVEFTIDNTDFQYRYKQKFSGNQWYVYIDKKRVCTFEPFEAYTVDEMKKHLENKERIKVIYNNGDGVCVYALPLIQYEKKYYFIYSLDGQNFFCWNDDILEKDENTQNRLLQLYTYVSEDILMEEKNKSWN